MRNTPKYQSALHGLLQQARLQEETLQINLTGLSHQDSLLQPQLAGNCINWVLGHLLWAYAYNLAALGKTPKVPTADLNRYARNSAPLQNKEEAILFEELKTNWNKIYGQWVGELLNLSPEMLEKTMNNNSKETLNDRINGLHFHQTYHIGQIGLLRRLIGKPGMI